MASRFSCERLLGDEVVRDDPENPWREQHRDVAEVGNVDLALVTRKDTGHDQVVGAGDQREKTHVPGAGSRVMQASKERRIGSQLAANA